MVLAIIILSYVLIGALIIGGGLMVHPEIVNGLDSLFFTAKSDKVNNILGFIAFLTVSVIWLFAAIMVVIQLIARHFED